MKIGWLANSFDPIGGAELTDATMLKEGSKKHTIIKITPKDDIPPADLYIFSNISKFKEEKLLEAISWKAPYKTPNINYFHDYEMALLESHPEIISKAELNIFLSPLHRFKMRQFANCTIPKSICIPSPIDPKEFYNKKNPTRNGNLYVGHTQAHKGSEALRQWLIQNPDQTLNHYGAGTINHPRASNHKSLPYKEMADLYNQYDNFVFMPMIAEPFARTVAEAFLCGCQFIGDTSKIGFFSYNWDYSNQKQIAKYLENTPKMFWSAIHNYKVYDLLQTLKVMFQRT